MSVAFEPGDRVRVLRNKVGAYKSEKEYLQPGDAFVVHKATGTHVHYYITIESQGKSVEVLNFIPSRDIELVEKFPAKVGDLARIIRHINTDKTSTINRSGDIITISGIDDDHIFFEYSEDLGRGLIGTFTISIPRGDIELLKSGETQSTGQEPECRCDNKYILHGTHQPECAYKAWRDSN